VCARWRAASRDDLIKELERQQQEIERLRREHERADQRPESVSPRTRSAAQAHPLQTSNALGAARIDWARWQ
jgi:hypothetical protein